MIPETIALPLIFLSFASTALGSDLYSNDYESGPLPGSTQGTGGGDLGYRDVWTLSRSFESGPSGRHVRFDFTVPSLPTDPNTFWYGGLSTTVGDFLTLPLVWELRFKFLSSSSQPEALRVYFSFVEKPGEVRGPRGEGSRLLCWVTVPPGPGWQQVVVRSSEVKFSRFAFSTSQSDLTASVAIAMSSNGPDGQPQSLSNVGNHFLLIDDLELSIPVTPFVSLHPRPDGLLSLFYSGTLETSDDLRSWSTPSPQPTRHTIIDPKGGPQVYYRATDG